MKYIKLYENNPIAKDLPQKGDYVYCQDRFRENVNEFIKDKNGMVVLAGHEIGTYEVHYDGVPKALIDENAFHSAGYYLGESMGGAIRTFLGQEIKFWAKTIEELELKKETDKYNL